MNRRKEIENDVWLAQQRDDISRMTLNRDVDVTDAVMERIAKLQPMAVSDKARRHLGMKIAGSAVAACIAIGSVLTFTPSGKEAIAPTDTDGLVSDISDVYEFFSIEESADISYLDDPIINLI